MSMNPTTATLVVCETCGYDEQQPDAVRKGELLARALEQEMRGSGAESVPALRLQRFSCLMSCKRHCVVQLRAPGRIGYVIGDLAPDVAAARTLLDYSDRYLRSDTGQVPYKEWPDAIKGKFIARIPVLDN